MQKNVKFDLFGNNGDYLYFGIGEMRRAEKLTKTQSARSVIEPLWTGEYSVDFILDLLRIGLAKCYAETGKSIDNIEANFEKSFENENIGLISYATVLYEALFATGFFRIPNVKEKAKSKIENAKR